MLHTTKISITIHFIATEKCLPLYSLIISMTHSLALRTSILRHVRILSHLHSQELPHLCQICSEDPWILFSILFFQCFPSAAPSPLPLPRVKWYCSSARKLSSKPQMYLYLYFIALYLYPNWSISVFIAMPMQLSTLWFPAAGFYHSTGTAATCLSLQGLFSQDAHELSTVEWELTIKS